MESQEGVESVEVVAPAVNTQATAGEAAADGSGDAHAEDPSAVNTDKPEHKPDEASNVQVGVEQREGDWPCNVCKNLNFARRLYCNRCHASKDAPAPTEGEAAASTEGGARPGDWVCPGCQNNNFARRLNCHRCSTPKSMAVGQSGGGHNQGEHPAQVANLRPGDWSCSSCSNHNFARRCVCRVSPLRPRLTLVCVCLDARTLLSVN
jgi:hypothetical protein